MRIASKPIAGRLGVVTGNVVSLRAKPDPDSERTTQAIIGQQVVTEGGQGDWLFVQTIDTYRGWIPSDSIKLIEDQSRPYASTGPVALIRDLIVDLLERPREDAATLTKATISAELEMAGTSGNWVELRLPDARTAFVRAHEAKLIDKDVAQTIWLPDPRKLIETSLRFVGIPYLWGGTTPFGLDCSGLIQLVHRIHRVTLLRDASMQAADERAVPVDREDVRAGDLVFFGSDGAKAITHVGMALDGNRFIHSCGRWGVTVTPLDDPRYSDIYRGARRMRLATLDPGGGAPED